MQPEPFRIGLTGSLAMGKSQTARLFAEEGIPVYDADAATHALYDRGGDAVARIASAFPAAIKGGAVDRTALSNLVAGKPEALAQLEAIVHPLVKAERDVFLARNAHAPIVVLDIPLLLETGAETTVDAVVVASAPLDVQRQRALSRPGMTEEKLASLLARQMPDVDKRAKAHFVVVTDQGVDHARAQVRMILAEVRKKLS